MHKHKNAVADVVMTHLNKTLRVGNHLKIGWPEVKTDTSP